MKWLVDMWNTYKDVILPILLSIVGMGGSFLVYYVPKLLGKWALKLGMDNKTIAAIGEKAKELVTKEEFAQVGTILKSVTQRLAASEEQNKMLAEMLKVAFDNTALNPDIKSQLGTIYSKILYKTEDALVEALESKLKLKEDEIAALKQIIQTPTVVKDETTPTTKRVRT